MTEEQIKKAQKWAEARWKYGLLLLALGFVVVPIILKALVGLAGLAVGAAFATGTVYYAPVFAMKAKNRRLKAIKEEAAKNPIETMQVQYGKRLEDLEDRRQKVLVLAAKTSDYEGKLQEFKEEWPKDAPKFDDELHKMKLLLERRQQKYERTKVAVGKYEVEIRRADALWQMAQATRDLRKTAGETNDDFMDKVKKETAIDSVTSAVNEAFAELDMELRDSDAEEALVVHKEMRALPAPVVDAEIVSMAETHERVVESVLRK